MLSNPSRIPPPLLRRTNFHRRVTRRLTVRNTVFFFIYFFFPRQSSTLNPQIDASNYICRAAQLLSKLYATFSRGNPRVLRD